jgi:hypothetical protein
MQPSIRDMLKDTTSFEGSDDTCVPGQHGRGLKLSIAKMGDSNELQVALYCPIAKTTRTKNGLMVYGWASVAEYVDDQDEVVDAGALREAVEEWKQWRNVRLMHQPEPIGIAPVIELRRHPETGRDALWIGAHIVDDRAIRLVETGVLKGFSIGGQCLERTAETIEIQE